MPDHATAMSYSPPTGPLLFSIAYRMLGSAMDAEDMVQEAYLRWQRQLIPLRLEQPRAFLTTVITRLCIDHLRSAQVQRESYVGPWLPEPLLTAPGGGPADSVAERESLSLAFLVMLERLSPIERAAFLLREVFAHGYDELARILETSEANARQLVSRARRKLDGLRADKLRLPPCRNSRLRWPGSSSRPSAAATSAVCLICSPPKSPWSPMAAAKSLRLASHHRRR
jgi:RNA polymerase sigma-70 factor, ECF subfamily